MKTVLASLFSLVAIAASAANVGHLATVSNVTFTQNAQQDVIVTYDLANNGEAAFVTFDVLTNGVPLPVAAVQSVTGDVSASLTDFVSDGAGKRIVWQARKDWKGNLGENASIVVSAHYTNHIEGVYLRVDVTGGKNASSWPYHFGTVEPDVSSQAFLWDELWLKCVPAGTFIMGSPASEKGREYYELDETQHEVTLTKPFFIGVTPITRKQWTNMGGSVAGLTVTGMEGHPAGKINFTWDVASETRADTLLARINQKTGLAGFALPTEAQWEYACRADTQGVWGDGSPYDPGTTATYPSVSTNLALLAWYADNSPVSGTTKVAHQVATRAPNAWGLYDFHGNVWEWCRDWAGDYPTEPVEDPVGPTTGEKRIRRGGSYNTSAFACRAAMRNSQEEINKNNQIEGNGIRFVLEF